MSQQVGGPSFAEVPVIFGHRGLSSRAPENTLAAVRLALANGVDWVEVDTDIIGDGTPILLHDSTLDRTTNRTGGYDALTVSDLGDIDAGSWFAPEFAAEPLPLLADLVSLINQSRLKANIEIKANVRGRQGVERQIDSILTVLDRLDSPEDVLISSFSQISLYRFHQQAPQYPTAVLFEYHTIYDDWRSVLELCGASAVHPQNEGLNRQRVDSFLEAGYRVNVWTVNDPARAAELADWGCSGLISDVPDVLLEVLTQS